MKTKIPTALILVLAISYVQADGHDYHSHHHHNYHRAYARQSGYGAPEPSYDAPAPSYGAPAAAAPSYDAPAPSYDAPAASYDAPADGYDAPSSGYGDVSGYGAEEEDIDLSFILYFSLIIIGLSLLFPSITELTDVNTTGENTDGNIILGRKRRQAEYEQVSRAGFLARSIEIYSHLNAALEPVDKNCIEKITCEVGALAGDAGLTTNPILRLAGAFVPSKYNNFYNHFVFGENCQNIYCTAFP